jgi:hypothetical protein
VNVAVTVTTVRRPSVHDTTTPSPIGRRAGRRARSAARAWQVATLVGERAADGRFVERCPHGALAVLEGDDLEDRR